MIDKIKILFLDDSLTDIELLQYQLKKDGIRYTSKITQDRDSYEKALIVFKPDIILSDYALPFFDGFKAFQIKQTISPETPFIVLSGTIGEQNAVELIKNGITDYNMKDKLFGIAPKIIRALLEAREHKEKIIAEKLLLLSEERYRYLFYNNPMPKWIYSEETKKFLEVNYVAMDKYGYSKEEFLSMTIDDIRPIEDRVLHNSVVKKSLSYGEAHHGVWRHRKKNGELFFVEITAHVIDYNGGKATLVLSNDITERKRSEEEILKKNKELRDLSNQLENIREEERTHIAREIHDELGQQITSLKMDIDWVSHKQNNPDTIVVSKLTDMLHLCDGIIGTVRRISSDLRPAIIDDLGLIEALEWKCNDFKEKMGIQCQFTSDVKERKFENLFSINVFRILQETLTNVARHAAAKLVVVSVSENESELILEITDNGKGFNSENAKNGKTLGILGMYERAALLGGKLTISGTLHKGTHTILTLPF